MKILEAVFVGPLPRRLGTGRKRTKKMRRSRREWRKRKAVYNHVANALKRTALGFLSRFI